MNVRTYAVAAVAAVALAGGAAVVGNQAASTTPATDPTQRLCADINVIMTNGECFAAGAIRFVALHNLQGAKQFCNWKAANPGEWQRLNGYAETASPPANIVTWFGGSIKNELEAYFATGAPEFQILPNTAPNICRTPLPPPTVSGVTPGQTDATVTIQTTTTP